MLEILLLLQFVSVVFPYDFVREYSGSTFFDGWDFYGYWDNLTLGDVWWLDMQDATSQGLAYINTAGNAVIRVDNSTNVLFNDKRNSVRITTQDFYDFGSLWIIDVDHIPFGCSVWPAFWSKGELWPNDGEIDIIEAVNLMSANQMALHTTYGCFHTTPPDQIGQSMGLGPGNMGGNGLNGNGQNASDCSTGAGCVVTETKFNSFGSSFAGGVWATQYDVAGIFIWYWPRETVPLSIQQATADSSISLFDWGSPSASYPSSSCTMENFFTPQQLVLDITLCGDWAGIGAVYNGSCGNSGPTGLCYNDNVVGPGSPRYDDAYFEINYIRAYTTGVPTPTGTNALDTSPTTTTNPATSSKGTSDANSLTLRYNVVVPIIVTLIIGFFFGTLVIL